MTTINNVAELEQIQGGKVNCGPAFDPFYVGLTVLSPLVGLIVYHATCG